MFLISSITSQFLCNGALDSCHDLSKLNLCRTLASNRGNSHVFICWSWIFIYQMLFDLWFLPNKPVSDIFICCASLSNRGNYIHYIYIYKFVVGVSTLRSDSLSLINLDGTRVKPTIVETLQTQCPNLRKVTTANIIPVNSDDEGWSVSLYEIFFNEWPRTSGQLGGC